MKKIILAALTALAVTTAPTISSAEVNGTKLGVLNCTIEGGFGLLLGSSKKAACVFEHAEGTVENYEGRLSKLGLDIGVTGESFMRWVVFTPVGNKPGEFALAGDYVGASADASLGIGLGANALVGGSQKKLGLQPVSLEGKTGLNLAIGLSKLSLAPAS